MAVYSFAYVHLKGLIPNPEEERDLVQLNRPLLDAVPEGDDLNIIDPDPIMRK